MGVDQHLGWKAYGERGSGYARDCLCETLKGCDEIGAKTIMHVHDEVICEVPTEEKETKFKQLLDVMAKPIDWAPDLVLVGDGFISDYYKKD